MRHGAKKIGGKAWGNCAKKTRYRSESAAQKTANVAMRYRPGQPLRVYDCAICGGWHITHQKINATKGQS